MYLAESRSGGVRAPKLDFGRQVFTAGVADPNRWSNHAWATDVGVNWYLNFYTKLYLDWQHSEFGDPVVTGSPSKVIFLLD